MLKVGRWLEANATDWGIVAIPVVIVLLMAGGRERRAPQVQTIKG